MASPPGQDTRRGQAEDRETRFLRDTFADALARPWRVTALAVGGLLAAIIVAGLLGFLLNRHIARVAGETLLHDVEVEDRGHDLQTAVLEVRHQHRNIAFLGDPPGAGGLERAYGLLQGEIDEYERLGVRERGVASPEEFRRMAQEYYEGFRPAVALAGTDREAFARESEAGLARLEELKDAADGVDAAGEELAEASLKRMEGAATTSAFVLFAAVLGLVGVGAALAYAAVRVVNQLRDFSKAKTEFLADVSHELRTPLTVLRGNAEVGLSVGRGGGCGHEKMLGKIVRESERMSRMVEDLLFLARSDSADAPLFKEAVAVAPFLAELAERAEVLLGERGCMLETDLGAEGYVDADRTKVEQAVMAVVDNAAKYGCPGGKVRLVSANEGPCLRVKIADEGSGIPEKDLPRVFERFYRPDKARSRALGGAGLGLSIARTVVEAHGGRIWADSRVGEGTEVSIRLPLRAGVPRPDEPSNEVTNADANGSFATRQESPGGRRA